MSQTYFAILTAVGEAKLANAAALGTQLQISRMAVGDGNGNLPVPIRTQTALVNETYRADLNELKVDPLNASQIIAELVIPETEGGYWLRELGLYDAAGDLIAVANCPPSYKPQLAEGSGRTQVLRMVLIVSSTAAVQLKIDPSVVLATRAYADAIQVAHLVAADPHPQYVNNVELAAAIAALDTVPRDYLAGLTLSNNEATPETDINIAPGLARSSAAEPTLNLPALRTKRLQNAGAWATGNGSNGLFTGARAANTWYHVFLIRRDADGAIDIGFDTSVGAENRPAGYGVFKRIGSIKTDSNANIEPFLQVGNRFYWKAPKLDVAASSIPAATNQNYVVSIPPGIRTRAMLQYSAQGANAMAYIKCPDLDDVASNATNHLGYGALSNANPEGGAGYVEVPTNEAAQVRVTVNSSGALALNINTLGWIEP